MTAASAALAALAACGSGRTVSTGPAAVPSTPVPPVTQPAPPAGIHDRAAAMSLAQSILAQVPLPPGARPLSGPSSPLLDQPPLEPGTPNLAFVTRFAVAGDTLDAVMAFARSNVPAGYTSAGTGSTSGPRRPTVMYSLVQLAHPPDGVNEAGYEVSGVAAPGGGVDLRVDGGVVWVAARPVDSLVPSSDTVAVVSVTEFPGNIGQPGLPAPRTVTVTDPSTVANLRDAANGLQEALPGVHGCADDRGTRYHVAFATAVGVASDLTFDTGSCDGVAVSRGGRTVTDLASDQAFSDAYLTALGLGAG